MSLSINMTHDLTFSASKMSLARVLSHFKGICLSVIDFTIMFLECANNTLNPKDSNTFRFLFYQF